MFPGWPQPLVLGEAIGAEVLRIQRQESQAWRLDINELADLITNRTKLIFLCNPNNPTGQVILEAELKEIVALADRVGAYVLCDEVYAGLEWDDKPIPRVANPYDKGISTGSVSKVLGLQGLRTGWLICRDRSFATGAHRTFVMPGSAYGHPHHLRLGFGGGAGADVAEGLERRQQFLETLRVDT